MTRDDAAEGKNKLPTVKKATRVAGTDFLSVPRKAMPKLVLPRFNLDSPSEVQPISACRWEVRFDCFIWSSIPCTEPNLPTLLLSTPATAQLIGNDRELRCLFGLMTLNLLGFGRSSEQPINSGPNNQLPARMVLVAPCGNDNERVCSVAQWAALLFDEPLRIPR